MMKSRSNILSNIDRAIEESQDRTPRSYLGMSELGSPCTRKVWYRFLWAKDINFDAKTIKRFDDGHRGEDLQAERLRMLPYITLETTQEIGQQFRFYGLGAHLQGHADGIIQGALESNEKCVWEHKQVNEKKFKELEKLLQDANIIPLKEWDLTYYGQACLYMHFANYNKHFMTVSTPGGRDTIALFTGADNDHATRLIKRAEDIIFNHKSGKERISGKSAWVECKFCNFNGICKADDIPAFNCRTCVYSGTLEDGTWTCSKLKKQLSFEEQRAGCDKHLYIPSLVNATFIAIDPEKQAISYANGKVNTPGGKWESL